MPSPQRNHGFVHAWYHGAFWLYLLWPLMLFYRLVISLRRALYRLGIFECFTAAVPVIVVGNITVGGTGKTPLVIALAKQLQTAGYKPGIISRGYGSKAASYPFEVSLNSSAADAGDEPVLIARATRCPLYISPKRPQAIEALLKSHDCDVIISDDGLQHYALKRDVEIVVVDGQRQFGNKLCLPAGPLREPLGRLKSIEFCVVNGDIKLEAKSKELSACSFFTMRLKPQALINLSDQQSLAMADWPTEKQVHAVAGIGNPSRFYDSLRALGFSVIPHAFDDHHDYSKQDLSFDDKLPIIMTEKDAVKVACFANERHWYLPVEAVLEQAFFDGVIERLRNVNI